MKTVYDCQHDAVMLSALIEGLWSLSENGTREASNGANALIDVIKEKAEALAADLDAVEMAERRAVA